MNACLVFITNVEGREGMEKTGQKIISACGKKTKKDTAKRPRKKNVNKTQR